ncbi:nucleotidyltransferase family protein [Hyphococcus luteus]|uniref:Nucleotidyltransferase-like domain-containing protein n=1 Tax=Hyphococcus luteus TaxID=2058213 RepID=A0A2S7K9U6_9PROT|nr:GSU2403 family nucleotidyltransferase fold protein [Marinicaulis flavus]PQA89219.1 hypothetical protein CW354_04580 [Marinicaulis flavus]
MAIQELPLVLQTSYAELTDLLRAQTASDFPAGSTFRKREISGKSYWYAQEPTGPQGRPPERYLGPDTEELAAAIERGQAAKADADARKAIIRSLKAAGLPEPDTLTAAILEALAGAGVFRLRGVVVGTVAFQTYAGLLGVRLPGAAIRTGDVDIAQDYGVAVGIDDALETSFLDILRQVDKRFSPVPHISSQTAATTYARPGGYRVDVLTTNRGKDRDAPVTLPSLKTDAVPLRFLDFLLKETVQAAVLSKTGVLVNIPTPERYAVHKLIVSTLRHSVGESAAKADKDVAQAATLIEAFSVKRRLNDFNEVLREAKKRGVGWRERLQTSAGRLPEEIRLLSKLLT